MAVNLNDTFFATRHDGQLYAFKRALREHEPMEIEEHPGQIEFEVAEEEEEAEEAEA